MQTKSIQRQYDEVIAPHYDDDPQSVIGGSIDRAVAQIRRKLQGDAGGPLKVLDVGMGTGRFLQKLRDDVGRRIQPFGLDLSEKMAGVARGRIPDLVTVVDDAENLGSHFRSEAFDLIATHFITGFVPARVLAPMIRARLREGGCWSLVGGTKEGFPALQKKANAKILRWMFGGRSLEVDEVVCNPTDRADVIEALESNGFEVQECETFQPRLHFANLNDFLEFGYYGGWLTPFVEKLGLHEARATLRVVLNTFVFPIQDHHSIEVVLAQKV